MFLGMVAWLERWSGRWDSNPRRLGYEPDKPPLSYRRGWVDLYLNNDLGGLFDGYLLTIVLHGFNMKDNGLLDVLQRLFLALALGHTARKSRNLYPVASILLAPV